MVLAMVQNGSAGKNSTKIGRAPSSVTASGGKWAETGGKNCNGSALRSSRLKETNLHSP